MSKKKSKEYVPSTNSVFIPKMPQAKRSQMILKKGFPLWKLLVFSLLPTCLLLVGAEAVVRIAGIAQPELGTIPLPEEVAGLFVPDPDLFWTLRPNLNTEFKGVRVLTNRIGLRSREVVPKADHEFRILSLGESATFGVGMPNDQTYTALIPQYLQNEIPSRRFTAFNAGTPAWSSFQSMKYLELHGLNLKPDLVLFYHEVNDYLPSTLRDSSNTEIGVRKTDRELYESRVNSLSRYLVNTSALFRFLCTCYARWSIQAFQHEDFDNPLLKIGLPDVSINPRLVHIENGQLKKMDLNEKSLGRRVSDAERLQNLSNVRDFCNSHGISLIIVHPAYRDSTRHRCMLTRFCRENGVLMYEAYDALHPQPLRQDALFRDSWHPNADGHKRLAMGLAKFIKGNLLDDLDDNHK